MWLDIADAPADVPATTAPWRNRSRIASARRVPADRRGEAELVTAGQEDAGRVADRERGLLVVRLGAGDRVERDAPA